MKLTEFHPLHAKVSTMGLFVELFHLIDGRFIVLGTVTCGADGLVFNAQYKRQLNASQMWQIMCYMVEHTGNNNPKSWSTGPQQKRIL